MFCNNKQAIKKGKRNGVTRYFCNFCKKSFSSKRRSNDLAQEIFKLYLYKKQNLNDLSETYKKSINWIKKQIDKYQVKPRKRNPRKVCCVCDATFVGKKKNNNQKGVLVFRDSWEKENLIWKHVKTEKKEDYLQLKLFLEEKGYDIQGVVIDGKRGVSKVFGDIPVQICQFHQVKIITSKLTRKPKLEAGKELRKISLTLTNTTEEKFTKDLNDWYEKWKSFLEERTFVIGKVKGPFTHKKLRSAYNSLKTNLPHLFTYQKYPESKIPNTTNSLDGGVFSHLKTLLKNHRGLRIEIREKLIDDYLNRKK